jgi:type IV pilus assembly protein PilM
MALYNAFRYNYADVHGCSLLIDIGARTTNLVFVEPNKVFSRSIPIGGTTFTTNITREFNESFAAAEERKQTSGFVSLGGSYAEPSDPDVARVSKIIRNSMTRLHAEIARSISFYKAQQGGSQPQHIYLCGGSVGLAYIREFFSEKLQMPIEFFNPLRNVTVSSGVNVESAARVAHTMGELVGLAIRSVSEAPMELNLEPASVTKAKALARKQPFMILSALCLILSLAGVWLYLLKATEVEKKVTDDLSVKINRLKPIASQFDATRSQIQKAQAVAAPFVTAVQERDFWVRLINDINSRLPSQYIWVTKLEPIGAAPGAGQPHVAAPGGAAGNRKPPGLRLRLHGLYLAYNQNLSANKKLVDDFADNLSKSPFVDTVTTVGSTNPTQTEWDFDYEFELDLKEGIAQQ